jgi:hypothetical protein
MWMKILLILLFAQTAQASDSWLCKEASSKRVGSDLYSCGVAQSETENEARTEAFQNAQREFEMVCNISQDCKGHQVSIEPKRMTCDQSKDGSYKCYRLIVFTILEDMKSDPELVQDERAREHEQSIDWGKWETGRMTREQYYAKWPN